MLQKAELSCEADSENYLGGSSETMYYIGLDVHKRTISYCVKDAAGRVYMEGKAGATRRELDAWIKMLPQPRTIAMEATIFTGWIYDHLLPHAEAVKVAHPLMLRAIAAAKRKNDRIDASKIADCLRCDFLPECHMATAEIRDRRRTLRYRELLVKQMVQMKNRVSGLLLEKGVTHTKRRLHKVGYFAELMAGSEEIDASIRPLLKLSREHIVRAQKLDYALVSSLERDPMLVGRLKRLRTVPGVGPITALTWALEIGDVTRFRSIKQAISYCGLCGSGEEFGRQGDAHAHFQAAQQAHSTRAGRGRETGAEAEPRTGPAPRKGDAEGKSKPRHPGCGQETGLLDPRGRTQKTGFRVCGKVPRHGGSLKTCLRMKKHQDDSVRRLPGPASSPLGEGAHTPEAHHELFRDWQRTQTQSSATALRSPRLQMDVWFCFRAGINGREATDA